MPEDLRRRLKEWADAEGRSVNEITVKALARAARRRAIEKSLDDARRLREDIRARRGSVPDSVEELRALRLERSERG
jgi:hypothetical protein